MRVAFFGTPLWAVPVLDALRKRHQVVLVVSQPDKPQGRGLRPAPSPVARYAEAEGLPLLRPARLREEAFREALRQAAPEVAVVAAYGKLIPKEALDIPPHGFLNLHPSLLPKYRGAAPVQRALLAGERETGVSIMRLDEGLDTGPLYAVWRTPILPDEDAVALGNRLRDKGVELLLEVLERLPELTPRPQEGEVSYAPPLSKEEGRLDFGESAEALYRRHRAVQPWPGSYFFHRGRRVKALRLRPEPGEGEPGVVARVGPEGVAVGTASGLLLLLEVQPEGRRAMPAADWARGYGVAPGTRLGQV